MSASILENKIQLLPVKSILCDVATNLGGEILSDGGRNVLKLTHFLTIAHIMPCLSHQSGNGGLHKALELFMGIDVACERVNSVLVEPIKLKASTSKAFMS